jgi:cysteine desulfurase/selenocysteine lyase
VSAVSATATGAALDVRADFPILGRELEGGRLVYLDSSSTSQKPAAVIEAIDDYYRNHNANIHRGVYKLAQEADALFEGARERIAAFLRWPAASTIFTANVTAAINLVAYSWARTNLRPGDTVLISEMEHHSNIVPWQLAVAATGAQLRYLEVSDDGTLSLEQLDAELRRGNVALVALTHVSNVLGTINPVAEIVRRAHDSGALALIDGAQAVPQLEVDLAAIDADFYAWTGHKALGPTGVGVLHARAALLEQMPPFLSGGDMIATVAAQTSTWNELPWKFEAGTSMIAEVVGLGAAIDYLDSLGMANVRAHEHALTAYALARLAATEGVSLFGPPSADQRGGVVSFALEGIHPHDVAELLSRSNVCIRASHHCAQPLMRRLGVVATARASFGPYNVAADVDALIDAIERAQEVFEG